MSERGFEIIHGGLVAGGALSLVGAWACWTGLGYGMGSWMRVGAGAFPVVVSGLMTLCGLVVMAEALWGDRGGLFVPLGALRASLGMVAGIASFALTIQSLGFFAAVALCVLFVSLAAPRIHWGHTVGLIVALPLTAWAIFALGLGQQLRAFG